mmetsp:Transcript_16691/g.33753  ORF Transcript_16691/g.33753 Transcript_16691/m.33753 type:complete len:363 (-) Transcript_16691:85-1173(-)
MSTLASGSHPPSPIEFPHRSKYSSDITSISTSRAQNTASPKSPSLQSHKVTVLFPPGTNREVDSSAFPSRSVYDKSIFGFPPFVISPGASILCARSAPEALADPAKFFPRNPIPHKFIAKGFLQLSRPTNPEQMRVAWASRSVSPRRATSAPAKGSSCSRPRSKRGKSVEVPDHSSNSSVHAFTRLSLEQRELQNSILAQKRRNTQLAQENKSLKTSIQRLHQRVKKKDRCIYRVLELSAEKSESTTRLLQQIRSDMVSIASLHERLRSLETELEKTDAELQHVKSSTKYTRIMEINLESKVYLEESNRITKLLDDLIGPPQQIDTSRSARNPPRSSRSSRSSRGLSRNRKNTKARGSMTHR